MYPIIHYSKSYASNLICDPKSKQQVKEIREKREGSKEKRIKVSELNECSPTKTSPKLKKIIQSLPNIVENKLDSLFNRILAAYVPIEYEKNDIEIEQKKGRPKKDEEFQSLINNEDCLNYIKCPFEEKLKMELESLELKFMPRKSHIFFPKP